MIRSCRVQCPPDCQCKTLSSYVSPEPQIKHEEKEVNGLSAWKGNYFPFCKILSFSERKRSAVQCFVDLCTSITHFLSTTNSTTNNPCPRRQ